MLKNKVLERGCEVLRSTPRWSIKKNLIEFPSVLGLVYISILLGLCARFSCSHDLLECSTLIT